MPLAPAIASGSLARGFVARAEVLHNRQMLAVKHKPSTIAENFVAALT